MDGRVGGWMDGWMDSSSYPDIKIGIFYKEHFIYFPTFKKVKTLELHFYFISTIKESIVTNGNDRPKKMH